MLLMYEHLLQMLCQFSYSIVFMYIYISKPNRLPNSVIAYNQARSQKIFLGSAFKLRKSGLFDNVLYM